MAFYVFHNPLAKSNTILVFLILVITELEAAFLCCELYVH